MRFQKVLKHSNIIMYILAINVWFVALYLKYIMHQTYLKIYLKYLLLTAFSFILVFYIMYIFFFSSLYLTFNSPLTAPLLLHGLTVKTSKQALPFWPQDEPMDKLPRLVAPGGISLSVASFHLEPK